MGTKGNSVISPSLKREEYDHTKHDSKFSEWKILIGPNDWENHSLNKDGAEKYRTQNLPNCSSCSGFYELCIVVSSPKSGLKVIPVYIGQAGNVRARFQQYGRDGAHLEKVQPNGELNGSRWRGLFTEVFSRGFSIAYRWAPTKNKRDAEKIEKKLLDSFDYAWNQGRNGPRRVDDILQKLQFGPIVKRLQIFSPRQVDHRLKSPLSTENLSSFYVNLETDDTLSRILKVGRSRPTLVSIGLGVKEDNNNICGVGLGQGSVCLRPPVEGVKRCAEHKGMRVGGSAAKLITEGKSHELYAGMASKLDGHQDQKFNYSTFKLLPAADKKPVIEDSPPICGVILVDGSHCTRTPVHRRERCEEHKGKKVQSSVSKSVSMEDKHYCHGPILEGRIHLNDYKRIYSQRSDVNNDYGLICGVDIENGRFCTRRPVVGRMRCEEHKGMRVKEQKSKQIEAKLPSVFADSGSHKYNIPVTRTMPPKTIVIEDSSSTCGATTLDGSSCRRKPREGSKWCSQHEGMRADWSSRNEPTYNSQSSGSSLYRSCSGSEGFQSTCGAVTLNGSACKRLPAQGRSRCWQHKGADWTSRNESTYISSSSRSLYGFQSTCGAMTRNGTACKRSAAPGSSRCRQH